MLQDDGGSEYAVARYEHERPVPSHDIGVLQPARPPLGVVVFVPIRLVHNLL